MKIKIGCCGWGYFSAKRYFGEEWKKKYSSALQAYAAKFSCVEINSTFYRIPKISTAEKWQREADDVNKKFEFSVKCSQLVTHIMKFSKPSVKIFNIMKNIYKALDAKILLLQSPASWKPTAENIKRMEIFFRLVPRKNDKKLVLAWEPRGVWRDEPELIKKLCKEFDLVNCVDPLRNEPQYFSKNKIAYFRLHGFGLLNMYNYKFSDSELKKIKEICNSIKAKEIWVMFNNAEMYEDVLRLEKII